MTIIIPPLPDLWWAEPCAGSGNILRQMPADRRIGWDINPLDNGAFGIVQADYQRQLLDPSKKWCVLTNPPVANQGPLTLFTWASQQDCVVVIGIVAPHFFQRHTIENKLHPYFHRVHREVLASDSFLREGRKKYIPSIFDIWARRDYMRDVVVVRTEHPDWAWLPTKQIGEADYWMQCYGLGFGDIKRPDNLGKIDDPSWHWFIHELRPRTIDRLKRLDWQAVAYPTVTTPRIHKAEVVRAYIAAYGDPEAPDYNPEDGDAGENVVAPEAPAPTPSAAPPEIAAAAHPDSHPDLKWIPLRRSFDEATVWIGRRGPNVGKLLDGTKQVPKTPADFYALRCDAPTEAIMRSIRWRGLVSPGGTLSKQSISREYRKAKEARDV